MATKEFLNILWTSSPRNVQYLFCFDHDPYALHMYAILKYRARKSAAMSRSCTCPGLQWAGPTREVVLERLQTYIEGDWVRENPNGTKAQREKALADKLQDVDDAMSRTSLSLKAKEVLSAMENIGYLDQDEDSRREVSALRAGHAVSIQSLLATFLKILTYYSTLVSAFYRNTKAKAWRCSWSTLQTRQRVTEALSQQLLRPKEEV